ncbi:TRADD-N-associated membrane domain-containing protein [Vibrio owensii]|uniref:TRADD-N-associated membrane domain-containing protein n=1 Tax=Vibrio owensii TaxID=696485 RepID=UPI003CE4FF5B
MISFLIEFTAALVKGWQEGKPVIRRLILASLLLGALAAISAVLFNFGVVENQVFEILAIVFSISAVAFSFGVYVHQVVSEENKKAQKIKEAEQRVKDNPKAPQAAWELAQVKLESYLNRNLKQVSTVFWLTMFVMLVGFSFIGVGVFKLFSSTENFEASVLATVAGILINFIGATFLVIYKSTMKQATEYVTILERINAVGMSVQILETISGEDKLKQQTTAELSKQLLALYKK